MQIKLPEFALVVLVGASGSGKSSFAKRMFRRTEIVASDECRALVSDSETDQDATKDAFELLYFLVSKRLKNGLLTVIDATNVQKEARKQLVQLARDYHCLPVTIVLDLPEHVCMERTARREDRNFGNHVIRNQTTQLKRSLRGLKTEGFRQIYMLRSESEVNAVTEIVREKLYSNKKDQTGPFDIIGDIHGCFEELTELLTKLKYNIKRVETDEQNFGFSVEAPDNRKVIFLGDLVDRGPDSP
ncbi:MAG: hypothetical protein RL757_2208, partial [Bacteroidota bacterium]